MISLPTTLLLSVLAAAPDAIDRGTHAPDDLARLQGRWTTRAGPRGKIPVVLDVEGRKVTVRFTTPQGLKIKAEGAIRLNEQAAPKALDWVEFSTPDGQDLPDVLGIYEFDGDALRVCNGGLNDARPAEFRPGEGLLAAVLVFKKEAKADGETVASGGGSR